MSNILEYKGYHSKIEFDSTDCILFGRIEGIRDLVSFESSSADTIEDEFHKAVDDYLSFCEQIGQEPEKEFKGSFNVRVKPSVHRDAFYRAFKDNKSLNMVVQEALENYLYNHEVDRITNVNIINHISSNQYKNYSSSDSMSPQHIIPSSKLSSNYSKN